MENTLRSEKIEIIKRRVRHNTKRYLEWSNAHIRALNVELRELARCVRIHEELPWDWNDAT